MTACRLVIDCSLRPQAPRERYVDLSAEDIAQRRRDAEANERQAWADMRRERDRRLAASDWTQLPVGSLSEAQRAAWERYRQALRDLPAGLASPHDPPWPTSP